ncbi:hypothetical protein ACTFIZ_002318 [Dictyostelium cf. discoideum]
MKEPMFSSNTASRSQPSHDDSDTDSEQSDDETSNDVDVPTEYQLSDTLLGQYKHMVNNQGLLVEEECILKKEEISEIKKVFNFPSNFSVNVAPFGTPDGISPLLLMSSMLSHDNPNVDLELIRYLAESAIVLAVNAQASISRVHRNNIAKEIYGSEVLLPIPLTFILEDELVQFDEVFDYSSTSSSSWTSHVSSSSGYIPRSIGQTIDVPIINMALINGIDQVSKQRPIVNVMIKLKDSINHQIVELRFQAATLLYWKQYIPITEICIGCLKHPISKVHYRAIAADSTSIDIETPTDYQIQKKYYSGKSKNHVVKFYCEDKNGEPQYYNNDQIIRKHDR